MMPVMEDTGLAERAESLTLSTLLYYSTVCGCGIDTVPVEGNATSSELVPLYADMTALAFRVL